MYPKLFPLSSVKWNDDVISRGNHLHRRHLGFLDISKRQENLLNYFKIYQNQEIRMNVKNGEKKVKVTGLS